MKMKEIEDNIKNQEEKDDLHSSKIMDKSDVVLDLPNNDGNISFEYENSNEKN